MKDNKKSKDQTEEITEIFKVEKEGKEEIIESHGEIKEKDATPEQIKKENKQLMNIFIGIGLFIVFIIVVALFNNSTKNFKYEGVEFRIVEQGDLTFYKTTLPQPGTEGYNFYLRNDPRKSKVEFEGDIFFKRNIVFNTEGNFDCGGYGIIAIENLKQLYEFLGSTVIRDENASCDALERYVYLNLKAGNTTKIDQTDSACYDIYINDCEILEGTEKFMIETLIYANEELSKT